jgi:copper(I)-binding protein
MTAAYGTLTNTGDKTIVINGISTEIAAHSSLHETLIERDRSTMRPVKSLSLAPGEEAELAPGGMHIMLMKLDSPLKEGQFIDICFKLENNDDVCHDFSVTKRKMSAHSH